MEKIFVAMLKRMFMNCALPGNDRLSEMFKNYIGYEYKVECSDGSNYKLVNFVEKHQVFFIVKFSLNENNYVNNVEIIIPKY